MIPFRTFAFAAALTTALATPFRAEMPMTLAGKTIVLDPGHAVLNDAGAIINPGARARRGAYEREVALKVAEKTLPLLEAHGAKVIMTRTPHNPWRYARKKTADNRSRAIFANVMRADAYVRLHCDWNRSRDFKGFTTYYFRWGSRPLAEHMDRAFARALPTHRNNGIHRRSFVSVTAKMPAVLMELGVLSHKPEAEDLADEGFQQTLAMALTEGIVTYFKEGGSSTVDDELKTQARLNSARTRVALN
jgi:N-acetylmuramoyl-L-alanine amidase